MKSKIFLLLLACLMGANTITYGQSKLNDYKYIIVPNRYGFLSADDQYQLNSLTVFLFNKYGFTALKENKNYPNDLTRNVCLGLHTDVEKSKGFLKLKLVVLLKNCRDEVIYTTQIGVSREKDFKRAYHSALREAFTSFENIAYNYKPNKNSTTQIMVSETVATKEIEKLKKEIEVLKDQKSLEIVVPVVKKIKKEETKKLIVKTNVNIVFYVQKIENGFKIIDSATSKVVLTLLTTPKSDVYLVKDKNAIVYKEKGLWYLSKNNGKTTVTKNINIKF